MIPWIQVGSSNVKKRIEVERVLAGLHLEVRSLPATAAIEAPVEDGTSFAANAAIKARHYALRTGAWTLADDSGLCVQALGGQPGIHSARFAGEPSNDQANVKRLMELLAAVPASARGAHFHCALALADPQGIVRIEVSGRCDGQIALSERGQAGFGYDPVFVPLGSTRTFAEMNAAEKDAQSHRGRALSAFRAALESGLQQGPAR